MFLSCIRSPCASHRSAELFTSLEELRRDPTLAPFILDVRGTGLMVGVEFASPTPVSDVFRFQGAPANLASRIAKRCQENGLFILTTSVYQVSVRFLVAF
jgi:4-aminobutyrate aminotransferase